MPRTSSANSFRTENSSKPIGILDIIFLSYFLRVSNDVVPNSWQHYTKVWTISLCLMLSFQRLFYFPVSFPHKPNSEKSTFSLGKCSPQRGDRCMEIMSTTRSKPQRGDRCRRSVKLRKSNIVLLLPLSHEDF